LPTLSMSKNYYDILGVAKTASQDEIKKAFRKKAHEYHPDKGNGNADKFKEVNEAYQTLKDPGKRQQYDQFGSAFSGGGSSGQTGGFNWQDFASQRGGYQYSSNVNFEDLSDIFGDLFGGGFGGSTRRKSQRRAKGEDMEAALEITLEEAVFGVEKTVHLIKDMACDKCQGSGAEPGYKMKVCPTCKGTGQVTVSQATFFGNFKTVAHCSDCQGEGNLAEKKCGYCQGRGIKQSEAKIKVKIPAGISSGETLKLSGQGGAGLKGKPAGDLYITIKVLPNLSFKREGDNLYTKKTITFSQAVLGDKVKVKTLNSEISLKVPAGTPAGRQFIVKGEGSYKLRGRGRGDLIVEIKLGVPDRLTREQKKLLEELKAKGL